MTLYGGMWELGFVGDFVAIVYLREERWLQAADEMICTLGCGRESKSCSDLKNLWKFQKC